MAANSACQDLLDLYLANKREILRREARFRRFLAINSENRIFAELAFCLLTPQSNALNCWKAVTRIYRSRVLFEGSSDELSERIKCARFKNKKARNITDARRMFTESGRIKIKDRLGGFKNPAAARDWFSENIKGMGCKEASHFLRNVGIGEGLAILDRHIIRSMKTLGVVSESPESLTKKTYLEIEERMKEYSAETGIPFDHLDLLLWFKETGRFFK